MAYSQGGNFFLYSSNQSHPAAVTKIARYMGIQPKDLVFIAELRWWFRQQVPRLSDHGDSRAALEELGRPVMMRIARIEEYRSAPASDIPGPCQAGFRKMGNCLPLIFMSFRRTGRTWAAAASGTRGMRYHLSIADRGAVPAISVLTIRLARTAARAGGEPSRASDRADK